MTSLKFDHTWTLFLDRDGVINRKIENGYVLDCSMFELLPGTSEAIQILGEIFRRIVIVTNQRGVARGLMSHADLEAVHRSLAVKLGPASRYISAILACTHDIEDRCNCRKPEPGLALQARARFPEIDFERSVIVGDSESDMELGARLGMQLVRISDQPISSGNAIVATSLIKWAHEAANPKQLHSATSGNHTKR